MRKPKGTSMDRPHTLKSGVALQSNYSVQHRSDILMEEQLATVHRLQGELKQGIADLDNAKMEEDIDRCRTVVAETKEKLEKALMVLQVLIKVNTELTFARAELDEALEKQEGDINEARKRVMWLEDRMGVLCGKARIRVQGTQKPKNKSFRSPDRSTFHSRMGSDSDKSSDGGYGQEPQRMGRNMSLGIKSDTTHRAGMYSASDSGSDYPPYQQQNRHGMADTPSSDGGGYMMTQQMGGMKGGLQDSDSDSEGSRPPSLHPGLPQIGGPVVKPRGQVPGSGSDSDHSVDGNQAPVQPQAPKSSVYAGSQYSGESGDEKEPEQSEGQTLGTSQTADRESEQEEEESEEEDEEEKISVTETDRREDFEGGEEEEEMEEEKEKVKEHLEAEEKMKAESQVEQKEKSEDTQVPPVFITEDSSSKMVTIKAPKKGHRQGLRVTFRDMLIEEIKVQTEVAEQVDAQEPGVADLALEYWASEHHRFEYSQYSEVLLEIDPLSYHNVGLALPGSFIQKPERAYTDLPWRSKRKGSDITDIHKIALDKLAGRVYSMYDKFYDAALLSVRPLNTNEGRRETTMLSAFDNTRDGARSGTPTDSRPGMVTAPPTTADGLSRQGTIIKPPEIHPSKMRPGLNVYHPKPIPPPEMLPLTRTSQNKEYPRLANMFLKEDDFLVHKPAVRIVDQRNLYKETKLKLYREKPKEEVNALSSTEKKFQMMLEQEKSMASKSPQSSRQSTPDSALSSDEKIRQFDDLRTVTPGSSLVSKTISVMGKLGPPGTRMSMARTVTKAEGVESDTGASTWSRLKPNSRGKEYSGLKWERVKTIVHVSLLSRQPDERRDAAKHLGLLRCGDAMVFFALKERLRVDEDERTRYEAAKSLILLGCWEEEVLQLVLKYLVLGNTEIRQDLIRNMIDGKNVQYINKKTPSFPELVKVLSHFCRNPDPDDCNAFDAAILLGRMCVSDENATAKLLRSLEQSNDTHIKAKALEVLVKQLGCRRWDVVQHLLDLLRKSPVWKYRALAADLLIILGKEHVCRKGEEERIYQILERKIWDDPTRDVRISAAKALAALGMFGKACERIEKRLEDTDEDVRAQAVVSVGTLEMKNDKIVRLLLEMLELDPSEYVRLMIARTFTALKLADKRVLRALRERDKVEGALARESRKALKVLESLAAQPRLTSPTGRKSMVSRTTPRGVTPRYTPAVMT